MAVPYTLAGWSFRPAPFNASKCGKLVKFSEECSVAEKVKPRNFFHHYDGVVYTAQPVPVGEVWRITLLDIIRGGLPQLSTSTTGKWRGGLAVGLTTELPQDVPTELIGRNVGPHEWIYLDKCIWHNQERRDFLHLASLEKHMPGQSVELLVTPSGQLHLFLNGQDCCEIATGLPVDTPLWGVAEIYARTTKIKSEIMDAPGADPSPLEGQSIVEQLQRQLLEKDAEIQRKSEELKQMKEEAEMQRAAQEERGEKIQLSIVSKRPSVTDGPLKSTIATSDLVVSKDRLGGGAQGTVFKGTWKGIQVAVKKCLQPDPMDVRILLSLGSHPNVIRLYGVVAEEISCLIVTELVKDGSLFDFLHKQKKVPSDDQRSYWMKDIAMGMEFLHHQGIAHRDLKSSNVLLGDRMMAKICDFGTARTMDHTTAQSTVTGTYRWMAPEIVDYPDARINKKCDIYSYGMVLVELVTLKLPFHDAPTDQKAMFNAMLGQRPSLPQSDSECPPFLHHLITACWDADPKTRPSFEEINVALDTKKYPL